MKLKKDSELIRLYIDGHEYALACLIERHKSRIYSFIFSKVYDRDLSEDIFQDTFIKVITTLKEGKYNEEGKFVPWVMRIAYNLTIDHFRAKKMFRTVSENCTGEDYSLFDFLHFTDDNIESELISEQLKNDLKSLVQHLPNDQREVLVKRIYSGLSFKEIADETNVSINTALGRMRYALINIRKIIEEKNIVLID